MPTRIVDNAYIFFKPTLAEVYDLLDDPTTIDPALQRRDFITISPTDIIKQTSNSEVDINFGTDFFAYLVTGCGEVLLDITEKTDIVQFTHSKTGIRNIKITLANIGVTYTHPVHIKLTQGTDPTAEKKTFYSNPFHISEDIADTTLFYYRDFGVLDGVDYTVTDSYNYIRVKVRFTNLNNDTPTQQYRQDSGNMIESRSVTSLPQRYVCEYFDNHGFSAFSYMLASSVIYAAKGGRVIGERVTSFGNPEAGELEGMTNFYIGNVVAYVNRGEIFNPVLDVTVPFALLDIGLKPLGGYTVAEIAPLPIEGYFNKNITLGVGTVTVRDEDADTIIATYTEADITIFDGSGFRITNFIGLVDFVSNFSINFTSGLFLSPVNETIAGSWEFWTTEQGDYDDADYTETQYFAT